MPQLPIQPAQSDLPSTTGIPLRTQRAVQSEEPSIAPGTGQILGQAVSGLGQSVMQAADLTVRTEAIKAQSRKAQNILDGKKQYQEFGLRADALYNQLQQGDYHTLPETFMEQSRQLMQSMGEGLNPQARQLYEIDALQRIDVLQSRAFGEYSKRRDNDTAYSLQQDATQFSDRYVNAENDYERIVARTQLRQTYDRYVNAGLITGAKAEHDYQLTIKGADFNRLKLLNQAAPEQMRQHYTAIQRGEAGLPGVPKPDMGQLDALMDDAEKEYRDGLEAGHRADLQAEKSQRKAFDQQEGIYRGKLFELLNTEAPPEAYTAFRRDISAARARGDLSTEAEQQLLGTATSLQNATLRTDAATKDDEPTLARFTHGLHAPSPQTPWPTAQEIREAVDQKKLTANTASELYRRRTQLLDDAHYSKLPEVQQGKSRIRSAIMQVIGDLDAASGLEFMRGPAMQRYLEADRLYTDILEEAQSRVPTPQQKQTIIRQLAGPLADQIQGAYAIQLEAQEKAQLPKLMYGVETVFEKEGLSKAAQTVEAMKNQIPDAAYEAMKRNLFERDRLKYFGGIPPDPSTLAPPAVGIMNWFKSWLTPRSSGNTPIIAPQ